MTGRKEPRVEVRRQVPHPRPGYDRERGGVERVVHDEVRVVDDGGELGTRAIELVELGAPEAVERSVAPPAVIEQTALLRGSPPDDAPHGAQVKSRAGERPDDRRGCREG